MKEIVDRHFAFGVGDSQLVVAVSQVSARNAAGLPISGSLISGLKARPTAQRKLLSDVNVRRLIIEMHSVFDRSRQRTNLRGKLDSDETLEVSREYRAVLMGAADSQVKSDAYIKDYTLWSLFETMFLKAGDSPICLDLMTWARETFTVGQEITRIVMDEHEQGVPLNFVNFWRAAAFQLLRLRFDICANMLTMLVGDNAAKLLKEHLDQLDVDWLRDDNKISRFEGWQRALKADLANGRMSSNMNIVFLGRLLVGEEKVYERMANVLITEWWHLMPLLVFAKYPSAAYNELGPVAEECRSLASGSQAVVIDDVDQDPFLAIFNLGDVSVLQSLIPNPWLSLHLVDTMFRSNASEQPVSKIRLSLLLDYGSSLIVNSNLWEVGADYLIECGVEGKLRLESHIAAMHISDDKLAEKLLRLCTDHELEESRTCIINTMTNRHLRNSNWSSALGWAISGGRSKTLDSAVNMIVWHATETEIAALSLLEHLDTLLLLSSSLSFLYQYYRFHKSLKKGDVGLATQTLLPLVIAPDVPTSFHSVLFGHLSFILGEMKQVPIPRETIYQLLSFFKQYTVENSKHWSKDDENKMCSLKRLLLTRLADAIVCSS